MLIIVATGDGIVLFYRKLSIGRLMCELVHTAESVA